MQRKHAQRSLFTFQSEEQYPKTVTSVYQHEGFIPV